MSVLTQHEERLLIEELATGSAKAFKKLYDVYRPHVYDYVSRLCKSDDVTADIVQDVFLKFWIKGDSVSQINCLEAYLISIAHNRTIDYFRHLSKEGKMLEVLLSKSKIINNLNDTTPDDKVRFLVGKSLRILSIQKRKIFQMSKYDGLSHDEIAYNMNLSKSTVKNHLSEALKHIRNHIHEHIDEEFLVIILAASLL
ncbi:MAG: polymerase sigma-70 factor [Sphingobacteriales bacterium]|nr:polymerase sigma-70 factor [Sphingobacteriales bacterium]